MKFSGTPIKHEAAPPLLGQHTDDILERVLKLDAAARKKLRDSGAI